MRAPGRCHDVELCAFLLRLTTLKASAVPLWDSHRRRAGHAMASENAKANGLGFSQKPVDLAWNSLSCSAPNKADKKGTTVQILNDVSGYARAGRLTSIMGPSGAGKTTMVHSRLMHRCMPPTLQRSAQAVCALAVQCPVHRAVHVQVLTSP